MPLSPDLDQAAFRRGVYWILIGVSTAIMTGRLATVKSSRGTTPMLSANDRSRWTTIRALVDQGTYAIDNIIFRSAGKRDPDWYTIDLVRHRGPDGRQHYYSSKPTLLTTLFAAPYWLIKQFSGMTLTAHPFYVGRLTLLLVNVLPMIGFLVLLARLCEQLSASDWSKLFVVAAAAFGTPLTTFAVTLNNHGPAAMCVLVATWALLAIWRAEQPALWLFVVAGLGSAMAAASDLPAVSFLAVAAILLIARSPRKTILGFMPPVLLVVAAAVGTNYWAHDTWSTPYAHRDDGPLLVRIAGVEPTQLNPGIINGRLRKQLATAGLDLSPDATLAVRPLNRGYVISDRGDQRYFALNINQGQGQVQEWDNWYEYQGSYWSSGNKQGVDRGESSKLVYALHALVGHHGIYSLTPIWLLSVYGMAIWATGGDRTHRAIALVAVTLTIVCLVFYILLREQDDRNYGGVSCCFRWMVWLIPLWLLCLLPALEMIGNRPTLRAFAVGLLLVSVFSATYNSHNPWSHPWLFDYWTHLGWIKY